MKPSNTPFFSIVVPTYNSGIFIEKTLSSIRQQSEVDYEVIISDDGSSDDTVRVVETAATCFNGKAKVLKNPHGGPGATRNRAILAARGSWIAFLDSDDRWRPEKLSVMRRAIERDGTVDLWCHSEIERKKEIDVILEHYKKFDKTISSFLSLYRQNTLSTSAVVMRKSILLKAGLFDETLLSAQDYDLWLRVAMHGKIDFVDDVLGESIIREGSISSQIDRRLSCLLVIGNKYRNDLLKTTGLRGWIEYIKFTSRVFMSCGLNWISSRSIGAKFKACFYIFLSFLCWPFNMDFYRIFLKKLFRRAG